MPSGFQKPFYSLRQQQQQPTFALLLSSSATGHLELYGGLNHAKQASLDGMEWNTPQGKAALEQYKISLAAIFFVTFGFCVLERAIRFWYPRCGLNETFFILCTYFALKKSTSVLPAYATVVIGHIPGP
jgi:hypothetical protein